MKHSNYLKAQLFVFSFFFIGISMVHGQRGKYSIPSLDTLSREFVIGGTSTSILAKDQFEYILNNQLTSYWIAFHESGESSPILDRFRRTQFNADLSLFYGVTNNRIFDVGIQVKYARSRIDNAATSSMLRVFDSQEIGSTDPFFDPVNVFDNSFGGLTYVGARFRLKPISRRPEFLINGGYQVSTVKDATDQRQLGADRNIADLGLTYYKRISNSVYYFAGASIQAFMPSTVRDEYLYNSNLSFFLVHRTADNKFTFFPGLNYSLLFKPSVYDEQPLIKTADFLFFLAGAQYSPSPSFSIILTGGLPLTLNVVHPNQKIVRASYSTVALGFRGAF